MKTIEKNCPNCGQPIEIDLNSTEIKCNHCKRIFLIEHDNKIENKEERLEKVNLVLKLQKRTFIIPLVLFLIILFLLIISTINGINKEKEKFTKHDTISYNLKSINELSDNDINDINTNSLEEIKLWNNYESNTSEKIGYYLIIKNSITTLYDVYKINYKLDSNNYDIYVAVAYENVTTDSGISYATTELHAVTLTIEDYDVWGFETEEDLYNSLPNTYDAKVIATNGLYKK